MTKADLVEVVARATDLARRDAELLVEIALQSVIEALNRGEKVELRGFGSFRLRVRNARRGRNPRTGEAVEISAKRVTYFRMGKELKGLINNTGSDARILDNSR